MTARDAFDLVVRTETMLWNRCDEELRRRTGLPLGRLEVLRGIDEIENCRVNDLAARLQITVGAVSKLVDRLEDSGHCLRQTNPNDRRSSVLKVTEIGKTALVDAHNAVEPFLRLFIAEADFEPLKEMLTRIERAVIQDSSF